MRKTFLVSLMAIVLTACQTGADSTNNSITIGYIGPLTGDASPYGVDTLNGMLLKASEINAAGGINGKLIEIVTEDGRCTGADAASAAQKLIHVDKVIAIIGGQCSGETLAAAPIAEEAGIIMISPLSSSPDVTDAGDFIFRDYPSDALKTEAMAAYFAEKGYNKVAVITENTDFAVAFRDALKKNLGEDALVFDEVVEPNTKDFRSLVTRLNDVDFDVFFPNGQSAATIGAMLQQVREQGFEQLAVSHDVAQDQSLLQVAPIASEGLQVINVPAVSDDSEFGSKFLEQYGATQAAMAFAAHAYDAMGVLVEAIGTVGTDGIAIRDYLNDLTAYEGVVGAFSFDANGDVVGIPYVLWEVQDGAYVNLRNIDVN